MIKHICIVFLITSVPISLSGNSLPFVKYYKATGSSFIIPGYTITISSEELQNEKSILEESFQKRIIRESADGVSINLILADVDLPIEHRKYRNQIYEQGYHLIISPDKIEIRSPSAAGIYYGIQTFLKCCTSGSLYEAEIKDWPDFPIRMIMVDPARQNENKSYYKRLITFCGQYKINHIQIHLTDDQTSCLFHKDYPGLMHPYALKKEDILELIHFASKHHIILVPEIESFGHSRMFSRLEDAKEYLHQTDRMKPDSPWNIIDIPGYTSMLCPASDKAITYLKEMYQKATVFESDCIHIGFDEVDLTNCSRCNEKFGNLSGPQLFQRHINHCIRIANQNFTRIGVWGDMILKHPEILDSIPNDKVIIYDWHYWPNVTSESVDFFKEKGFEIIACPSLVCWPHIMFPDHNNYTNISRFTRIAYEKELLGVNTTIWAPMRYMSDILWTGIAYAAVQSWAGSNWNETGFYKEFAWEFFGSKEGDAFMKVWNELCNISIHLDVFFTGSWLDHEGLDEAKVMASERDGEFYDKLNRLQKIQKELSVFGNSVTRHCIEWNVIEQTTAMRIYILQHVLASNEIITDEGYNIELLKQLDESCLITSDWIENDWDRNRYSDDPNKNGIYVPTDHLLYRFNQMHKFHQTLIENIQD